MRDTARVTPYVLRSPSVALALCAALVAPSATLAQSRIRVAPRVGVELQPAPRFTLEAYERFVHGDGIAASGRAQTFIGAGYSPLKWLDFGVGYRISGETYRAAYWSTHRAQLEAGVAGSFRGFKLSYRLRWQSQFEPSRAGYEYESSLRSRAQLRYRTPVPVDLTVSGELFTDIVPAVLWAGAFRFEAEITGRVDPVELSFGYRYHGEVQRGFDHYHMVLATVTWRWEAPRRRDRDRPRDPSRPRRRDRDRDRERRPETAPDTAPQQAPSSTPPALVEHSR